MSDDTAQAAGDGMSEERLARLAGLAELPCTCGNYDCERYTSALTKDEDQELLAEVRRARRAEAELRARLAEIGETRQEWGVRGTSGIGDETWVGYAICETEEHARAALNQYRAVDRNERNPIERTLVKRLAGEWREVEQEAAR